MDIVSGSVIDLEMLEYYPEITGNQKALEVISELISQFSDAEVRVLWISGCLWRCSTANRSRMRTKLPF